MKPELVVYVANEENAKAAIKAGADAVAISYRNIITYNSPKDYVDALASEAYKADSKLYLNLDVFAHDKDLKLLEEVMTGIMNADNRVDAFIVQDPGVFSLVQRLYPEIPIHVDQLVNVTNATTALMWKELGATRVCLANVLSVDRICEIAKKVADKVDLEVAIAGTPCISYSGRNLLDGFKKECGVDEEMLDAKYSVEEEQRPGKYHMVEEDAYGTYIYDSKEWNREDEKNSLIESGIAAFRVDGMMATMEEIEKLIAKIK